MTASLTVNYLAPARGNVLEGSARVLRGGRSLAFVELEVAGQDGRPALSGSGVWLLAPGSTGAGAPG